MRASLLALGLMVAGILGFGVTSACAAADYFLKIEGIPGEVTSESHKEWITLQSFQSGVTNPPTATNAGSTGFVLTKRIDKATPKLMLACAQEQKLDRARLEVLRQGVNQPLRFFILEMEDVYVNSFGHSAPDHASSDTTETLSLRAGVFTTTYLQFDPDDQSVEDLSVYWDFIRNEGGILPAFKLVVQRENNTLRLTWPARADRTYNIHGGASFDTPFEVEQTVTAAETGPFSTTVPLTSPHRFFYVEEVP